MVNSNCKNKNKNGQELSRFVSLAFLPPEPTYSLHVANILPSTNSTIDQKLSSISMKTNALDINSFAQYTIIFSDKAEWQHSQADMTKLDPYFVTTSRHNRIACLYVNCTSDPKYYILFSHGNAVDLGKF